MGPKRCDCYKCPNILETVDEVVSGVCEEHFELLNDDDNYIGICNNCLKITIVGTKEDSKGKFRIKDKYIFSKGCRHCTNNEESNISWMTIKLTSHSDYQVTEKGKLELITDIKPVKIINK